MTTGIYATPELFAVNLDIQTLLVLHKMHASVKEVVLFGWMTYPAREMKGLLYRVGTEDGVHITAFTMKMHR